MNEKLVKTEIMEEKINICLECRKNKTPHIQTYDTQ